MSDYKISWPMRAAYRTLKIISYVALLSLAASVLYFLRFCFPFSLFGCIFSILKGLFSFGVYTLAERGIKKVVTLMAVSARRQMGTA